MQMQQQIQQQDVDDRTRIMRGLEECLRQSNALDQLTDPRHGVIRFEIRQNAARLVDEARGLKLDHDFSYFPVKTYNGHNGESRARVTEYIAFVKEKYGLQ